MARRLHTRLVGWLLASAVPLLAGLSAAGAPAPAAALPEIRMHTRNRVPACVTPTRLMRFLVNGNPRLKPQFRDIARHYKEHGERLNIRWDYAFYQMILETNYLIFKNGAGQGDVDPRQNNFAGIGTTGGGVPGDSFPDVATGVLGQMQHLIAYSGERVATPVARRTREKQDEIIQRSKALGRAVTFRDLTRRWAADGRYGTSIEFIASRFRAAHCNANAAPDEAESTPQALTVAAAETTSEQDAVATAKGMSMANRRGQGRSRQERRDVAALRGADEPKAAAVAEPRAPASLGAELASRAVAIGRDDGSQLRFGLGAGLALVAPPQQIRRPNTCKVLTASYGGRKNVLVRALVDGEMQYTALQVLDGFEKSLTESFIKSHARGGESLGEFATREAALLKAFDLCPEAPRPTQ